MALEKSYEISFFCQVSYLVQTKFYNRERNSAAFWVLYQISIEPPFLPMQLKQLTLFSANNEKGEEF
jgi:hypothetical protein